MARVRQQAAVIPYRIRKERVEVALVTTSGGKGWIVPKGSVDDGEHPRDAAIREAEEEAGLRGVVARKRIGRYLHVKGNRPCRVDVYLMRVTDVLEQLARGQPSPATLDADSGCRDPPAARAAAVRPRCRRRRRTGQLIAWALKGINRSPTESAYVVRGDVSPEAIARSLQAVLPARHHPIVRHRFTVLDTFDGRVRRAGARLTRAGVNGSSAMVWQPLSGGRHLTVTLKQPVSFAWDLPDGPLQQTLAPVIGVRRLLEQADAETFGSLLEILDDRNKTVARLRIESGRARRPVSSDAWRPLPTVVTLTGLRGYEDAYERLVPVIESRPGIEGCPEGLHGVMLRQVGAPEPGDASALSLDLASDGARRRRGAADSSRAARHPRGKRTGRSSQSGYRVPPRFPRGRPAHALASRADRHVFPPDAVEHFSTEFCVGGALTGPPRDLDVLVLALRGDQDDIRVGDMEALTAFLGQAQQREHRALVEALDGSRYRRLLSEWKAFLKRPASCESEAANAGRSLADVVSRRAWRLSRRIADQRRGPSTSARTAARLHEVRIAAKKLRYLVDVTPGVLRRSRSRARPGCPEETAACARRLQRRARAGRAARSNAVWRWAPPVEPPARCWRSDAWPSRAGNESESLRPEIAERLARFRAPRHAIGLPARVQTSRRGGASTMNVIAVYNMKGGVGKTTTAVNLSYLAAAGGRRDLLWDLDLAGGLELSPFACGRAWQGSGRRAWRAARRSLPPSRETDYDNLDLLPADFAYRKLDRLLGELGKPEHVLAACSTPSAATTTW